jgi:hypothetical protein
MRHDHANYDRSYRWIEGRCGLLATRVTSCAAFGQAMPFGFLPKGAFSTV